MIPYSFVTRYTPLTWMEVLVGVKEGWLNQEVAVDRAVELLEAGSSDPLVIDLAGLLSSEYDQVTGILDQLVSMESAAGLFNARLTWLRLIMAWVYENRSLYRDPLDVVEQLYADFGYPDELRSLVRYNVPADTDVTEFGEDALLRYWKEYLAQISWPESSPTPHTDLPGV